MKKMSKISKDVYLCELAYAVLNYSHFETVCCKYHMHVVYLQRVLSYDYNTTKLSCTLCHKYHMCDALCCAFEALDKNY